MTPRCRLCSTSLHHTLLDLGKMPLANVYPKSLQEAVMQPRYPLHARVCERCLLVQVDDVVSREQLFSDYAYFSSYSASWLDHGRRFTQEALGRLRLGPNSLVVEVASNDGYLLRHFRDAGVPVLGIDPAANVAQEAIAAGIRTETRFFGLAAANDLSNRGLQADLLVANNVLAHVPDLNDFVAGLARILKPDGVLSVEVPHLLNLLERVEFDTIYHEHYSYFSLLTAERILATHGLKVYDVEEVPTHGGSLRVWAVHTSLGRAASPRLEKVRVKENAAGLTGLDAYDDFAPRVEECRRDLLRFMATTAASGKTIVAYGAAAKGNTLLNHCRIGSAEIDYVVDRNPYKQGRFLPGSHIPICDPGRLVVTRPDVILILPWNIRDEICQQMCHVREWGCRLVVPIPRLEIVA